MCVRFPPLRTLLRGRYLKRLRPMPQGWLLFVLCNDFDHALTGYSIIVGKLSVELIGTMYL